MAPESRHVKFAQSERLQILAFECGVLSTALDPVLRFAMCIIVKLMVYFDAEMMQLFTQAQTPEVLWRGTLLNETLFSVGRMFALPLRLEECS